MYEEHIVKGRVWTHPESAHFDQAILWGMMDPGKTDVKVARQYTVSVGRHYVFKRPISLIAWRSRLF